MMKNEDEFWNTSSSSGFNFDDEEEETFTDTFSDLVFNSKTERTTNLPIHSIISKTGLDLVLDDVKSTVDYVAPSVEDTVKKMVNGHKYMLEIYRTLDEKLKLLDSALQTLDGNIITEVVLFLKHSLNTNIFYHQLSKRKLAIKHYANYLIINNNFQELLDTYMATGNTSNMKYISYLIANDTHNKSSLTKRLNQFVIEHLQNNTEDKMELQEYIDLLQWQSVNSEKSNSMIEQLASLCKKEWTKNQNSTESILQFKKQFKIDDFSFEWTVLNVMASLQMWPQLTSYFFKPNWLTKNNTFKTVIDPELFVTGLNKHKPPSDVLEAFLSCITDGDRSLYLAEKFKCHKYVIRHFINQKDRLALLDYKIKVPSQSQEYSLLESALISYGKKWKN